MSEWISVKDRLPDYDLAEGKKWYLVTNGERCDVAMLIHGKSFFGHSLQFADVTHWQSLPAPPTKESAHDTER